MMKHYNSLPKSIELSNIHAIPAEKFLKQPVEECDIMDLHNILLTEGLHFLNGVDKLQMRPVIMQFLKSLNFYHNVGLLTLGSTVNISHEIDLLHPLLNSRHCWYDSDCLYDFFLEDFGYDFLLIEIDEQFTPFIKTLIEFNVHKEIPVVLVGEAI